METKVEPSLEERIEFGSKWKGREKDACAETKTAGRTGM